MMYKYSQSKHKKKNSMHSNLSTPGVPSLPHLSEQDKNMMDSGEWGQRYKTGLTTSLPSVIPSIPASDPVVPRRYEKMNYSKRIYNQLGPPPRKNTFVLPPVHPDRSYMCATGNTDNVVNITPRSMDYSDHFKSLTHSREGDMIAEEEGGAFRFRRKDFSMQKRRRKMPNLQNNVVFNQQSAWR